MFVDRITRRAHHPSHPSSASPLERVTPRAPRRSRRSSSRRFRRRPPTSFVFSLSFSLSFLLPSFVSSASDRCWTKITTLSLMGIRACAPRACPLRRKFFTRSTIFSSWGRSTASIAGAAPPSSIAWRWEGAPTPLEQLHFLKSLGAGNELRLQSLEHLHRLQSLEQLHRLP